LKLEQEITEVIQDEKRILQVLMTFFARARTRLDMSVSYVGPRTGEELAGAVREAGKRGVKVRMVTEVTRENLEAMRVGSRLMEVRHIAGLRGNSWAVTQGEYVSSLAVGEFRASFPIIYSNAKPLVAEHQSIFDALWGRGEPLEERVEAIKSGTDLPEMEIIRDAAHAKELYLSLASGAEEEVLVLFPTSSAFRRDDRIGVIRTLEERASKGVKVKLLTPVDPQILRRLSPQPPHRSLSYRFVQTAGTHDTVTVLVVDGSASLTIDERDPSQERFEDSFGSAILATREPRVRQNVRMFDRIWKEIELGEAERTAKEREEVSRKRAELMQDILTHDIRNFNQVARLNAELLGEEFRDRDASARVSAILRAVDGSTKLIERAKKLGAILAAKSAVLKPTSLNDSLGRSVQLVKKANPTVTLRVEGRLTGRVLADELLDEVFVNLLSNSVKYTDGKKVTVIVGQSPGELSRRPGEPARRCWKISVSDKGKGIPDDRKDGLFRRYLETAKGSGLGLSIVYALVAERYGGAVDLKDRVKGDFTKGTTAEILLPRA
jgi:two-component system, OmpR family, sensor histidine kinase VicK